MTRVCRFVLFILMLGLAATTHATLTQAGNGPEPGTPFRVEVGDLPELGATPSASQPSIPTRRPDGATVAVPPGYAAALVTDQLQDPRNLLPLPDGSLLIAESQAGKLVRWTKGGIEPFAEGFFQPYGLAYFDGSVWVAGLDGVWRMDWLPGRPLGKRVRVTRDGALGGADGHQTRSLAISPDGRHFYVGVGSRSNMDIEPTPRATVQQFNLDGTGQRDFATGLRNPVGLTFRPGTTELWTVVNERDHQGDELVPDYLAHVNAGDFFGWPYFWIGAHPQPEFVRRVPPKQSAARLPDVLFRAHSAPLGLTFWNGDAYVALHGSWNRSHPQGYFVARIPFEDGKPQGGYEVFASGFMVGEAEGGRALVWGRPVGLTVGADNALYLCDDLGGTLWKIVKQP